jgi:hypothetical protein
MWQRHKSTNDGDLTESDAEVAEMLIEDMDESDTGYDTERPAPRTRAIQEDSDRDTAISDDTVEQVALDKGKVRGY